MFINKDVFLDRICCSRECGAKRARKIVWPEKAELAEMIRKHKRTGTARILGVSEGAVRKRERRYA